jgi:type II secretory pathway pseudopilin PulG
MNASTKKLSVKRYSLNACDGFTLIELLLYIGISSTLLISLVIFLGTITRAHIKNAAVSEVEYQGARVMEVIRHVAATAQTVNSPAEGASAATLSLNISTTEDNPTVFDISGSKVRITQGASAPVELTSSRVVVSDLIFNNLTRPDGADVVRVSFTLAHANPSGGNEYEFAKTFYGSANLQK